MRINDQDNANAPAVSDNASGVFTEATTGYADRTFASCPVPVHSHLSIIYRTAYSRLVSLCLRSLS